MRLNPFVYSPKWLLALTLFFSLFSFLGYTAHVQSRTASVQQTEWVASARHKSAFQVFTLRSATTIHIRVDGFSAQSFLLLVFNRLDMLQFKTAMNESYSFDTRRHLILGQIITSASEEELLSV
jgi:hypothetical protein